MLQQTNPTPNNWSRTGAVLGAIPGIIVDSFLTTFGVASSWGYSDAFSLHDDEAQASNWRIFLLALTAGSITRQCSTMYYSEPNQHAQTTLQGGFFKAVGSPYSTLKRQFLYSSVSRPRETQAYHSLESVRINL